ncbi:GAF domain-containing protein [bacterium SCSIO 12643]|nr:GAF domain-containing protein [bacterium SCSIO 12643]
MSENLQINKTSKKDAYETLLPQVQSLIAGEVNLIANLANACSAIQMTFDHLWTGFYLVDKKQLVLGPFQGPIACTRIPMGKGVCGTAWKEQNTVIVKNVNEFEGHIACSSDSVSEIVVPLFDLENNIIGVLDIDSAQEAMFDETDQKYLEKLCLLITKNLDC